jgi:rare lipoprotein A
MDGALNGLEIVPSGEVHRLYAGPYASRQDAALAIPGLPSSMGLKPLIIQR